MLLPVGVSVNVRPSHASLGSASFYVATVGVALAVYLVLMRQLYASSNRLRTDYFSELQRELTCSAIFSKTLRQYGGSIPSLSAVRTITTLVFGDTKMNWP